MMDVLDSIVSCDLAPEEFELIIVDGMSTDDTVEIAEGYRDRISNLRILDNPDKTVPYAMNKGIREAKGEYVIRIDAHSKYPVNYFSYLLDWHKKLDAANVGVAFDSRPKYPGRRSNSIAAVLSDPLGVGDSHFRLGVDELRQVDTVPFGCFKRADFKKYGMYDERLAKSQDIELNKRIIAGGGKIYLLPDIELIYFIRSDYTSLLKKYFVNGMWNFLVAKFTGTFKSLSLRNFVPTMFILYVLVGAGLSFIHPTVSITYWMSILLYGLIILFRCVRINTKETSIPHLFFSFMLLHTAHGAGGVVGLLRQFFIKRSTS